MPVPAGQRPEQQKGENLGKKQVTKRPASNAAI
jgi:hypothetical protein